MFAYPLGALTHAPSSDLGRLEAPKPSSCSIPSPKYRRSRLASKGSYQRQLPSGLNKVGIVQGTAAVLDHSHMDHGHMDHGGMGHGGGGMDMGSKCKMSVGVTLTNGSQSGY